MFRGMSLHLAVWPAGVSGGNVMVARVLTVQQQKRWQHACSGAPAAMVKLQSRRTRKFKQQKQQGEAPLTLTMPCYVGCKHLSDVSGVCLMAV
jgi:hypothetical protein